MKFLLGFSASAAVFGFFASLATYAGNPNFGFGAPIALGSTNLTDKASTISVAINSWPNGLNEASTFSFTSLNVSQPGLTPNTETSFYLFRPSTPNNDYHSDEPVAGNDVDRAQAWTPFLQTTFGTYTTIPEPSTLTLFGLAALLGLSCLRCKKYVPLFLEKNPE